MADSERLEAGGTGQVICASHSLIEAGRAVRFETIVAGELVPAFAIRFAGRARAYVNRCPHRWTQLDWTPGEIFDDSGLYLICATHGACFEPSSGLCLAGPCRGDSLTSLAVDEHDGVVRLAARLGADNA